MAMIQLVSASVPACATDEMELHSMLAIGFDGAHQVTGAMVFQRGFFLIVLEGDAEGVDALYERMSEDPRHASLTMISRRQISRRSKKLAPVASRAPLQLAA